MSNESYKQELRDLKSTYPDDMAQVRAVGLLYQTDERPGSDDEKARVDALTEENALDFFAWVNSLPEPVDRVRVMRLLRPSGKLTAFNREWASAAFRAFAEAHKRFVFHAPRTPEDLAIFDEVMNE